MKGDCWPTFRVFSESFLPLCVFTLLLNWYHIFGEPQEVCIVTAS